MPPTTPQVILIGGAPGVGKSTLGRAVAARLGWASLTVDDIMIAVRAATTPQSNPALHPMRIAGGHVRYFTDSPPEQLVEDATAQEAVVWPMVDALIRTHLGQQKPIVIDWWLLSPLTVAEHAQDGLASVWLHLDPEVLRKRERSNTDFLSGSDDPDRMLANFMQRSLWRNELVAAEAEQAGLPLLRLDGSETTESLVDRVVAGL